MIDILQSSTGSAILYLFHFLLFHFPKTVNFLYKFENQLVLVKKKKISKPDSILIENITC